MANIRTSNKHHLRAVAARLARSKAATAKPAAARGKPAKAAR